MTADLKKTADANNYKGVVFGTLLFCANLLYTKFIKYDNMSIITFNNLENIMIKAVLFDFDGTLIDTNDLIYKSYCYAFNKIYGRDIKKEEFLNLYGRPLTEALSETYGVDGKEILKEYQIFNEENHDKLVKAFPGAVEGLKYLKEHGIKIGVVTSKRQSTLEKGINFLGINGIFDVLITPDDTKKHKPNPEPVLLGCEKLCEKPENTVYVGDSVFDIKAGIAAKVKTCVVSYSLTEKEKILKLNPDYFVDSIYEFAEIITKGNGYE